MLEIIKVAEHTKVSKMVEFFIKSVTVDPNKLFKYELSMNSEFENEKNALGKLIYITIFVLHVLFVLFIFTKPSSFTITLSFNNN